MDLPKDIIEILLASWSLNTRKSYNSALRKYKKFCEGRFHPFKPSVNNILEFLKQIYEDGNQFSSVSLARSMLSTILKLFKCNVMEDFVISQYLKGLQNINPPKPRYSEIWDARIALENLRSWGSIDDLSTEKLTYRTILLFLLATGQRVQTAFLLKASDFFLE